MSETQEGYLLIVDITGYTQYLSASELDHAQETLTVLLKLLVEHTRPPLVISRLEGDAVISYGLRRNFFQGQTFVEVVEDIYVSFRKAIERMVLNNTCRCNACANIANLDLKFFIHYGMFAFQHIGGHDELVGSDVNLIHRLLKNTVQESTGIRAYTLWTDAAIQQLELEEIRGTMVPHHETYEHLGEVQVWVQDMHPVWKQKRTASQVTLPAERIARRFELEFSMPQELLWDYLTRLDFRDTLMGSDREEVIHRSGGRIASSSVYQCYHGDKIIPQTILEWQPFERMLLQTLVPIPIPKTTMLTEYQLVPTQRGTLLVQLDSKPEGPLLGRLMINMMSASMAKQTRPLTGAFKQRVEDDWREHQSTHQNQPDVDIKMLRQAAEISLADRSS